VRLRLRSILIPTALGLASIPGLAQLTGGPFEIPKSTIDGGGGRSTGGQFILTGTIGQPEGPEQTLTGGNFELSGGFWPGGEGDPEDDLIFSDGFEDP